MNTKLKSLLHQLLQSPRRFPVELALGIVFFIIAVWDSETHAWNEVIRQYESSVNGDILWFFVPLMALTFWLHRVNRWAEGFSSISSSNTSSKNRYGHIFNKSVSYLSGKRPTFDLLTF